MDENKHLEQFKGKGSILTSEYNYRRFFRDQEQIGRQPDSNDPQGSMFISSSADIDKALKECNGDITKLESSLGLQKGILGDGPLVRIDINNPENNGLRISNGKEAGANEFWNTKLDSDGNLPMISYTNGKDDNGNFLRCVDTSRTDPAELGKLNGQYWDEKGIYHPPKPDGYDGKTSGNLAEAVINQVPNRAENISYTKIDGFKRGEDSNLCFTKITDGYDKNFGSNQVNSQTAASSTGGGTHAPPMNGNNSDYSPVKKENLDPPKDNMALGYEKASLKDLDSVEKITEDRKRAVGQATGTESSLNLTGKDGLKM